jgi:transcription elongation GreA/GreB family factor
MTSEPITKPTADPTIRSGAGVLLSAARFAALMDELQSLRASARRASTAGGAGLGSIVKVEDRAGRTLEYELVTAAAPEPKPLQATLDSPTGEALLGARPGDFVRVALPNGRTRRVRVRDVTPVVAASVDVD